MALDKSKVVHAKWQLLIDVFVMKGTRSSQSSAQVCVEIVSTPESSLATFEVNVVDVPAGIDP